jgi:putative hydrolase of the HAD superfamily
MLRAVIFDLDDTLIDWEFVEPWEPREQRRFQNIFDFVQRSIHPLGAADASELFAAFGLGMRLAWENGVQTMQPPNLITVLAETLASFGVPEERLDMDAVMKAYDWQCPEGLRAFPDALEVLPQLHARGIALGLVTNSSYPMSYRDRELEAVGLLDLFPTCRLSAVDVGYLKPHRAIFDRALDSLSVRAEEAVFVGDSLHSDVRGAQGAGMFGVWRLRHPDQTAEGSDVVPDGTILTLHELPPLLEGWYPGWGNGTGR